MKDEIKHDLQCTNSSDKRIEPTIASKISDNGLGEEIAAVVEKAPSVSFNREINKSSMKNKHFIRVEDTVE